MPCLPSPADTFSTWTPRARRPHVSDRPPRGAKASCPAGNPCLPAGHSRFTAATATVQVAARSWLPDQAGKPGRAHAVAARIRDNDVIGGQRAPPVREGGHRRDLAVADTPVVRRADLDPDHRPARARVQECAERSDGLREHAGRAPCSRPWGWVLPSTGMVATTRDADADRIVMPIRPASVPSATVLAMIFSSVSWSIRNPAPASARPVRFKVPTRAGRHREAPVEPPQPRPSPFARGGGRGHHRPFGP